MTHTLRLPWAGRPAFRTSGVTTSCRRRAGRPPGPATPSRRKRLASPTRSLLALLLGVTASGNVLGETTAPAASTPLGQPLSFYKERGLLPRRTPLRKGAASELALRQNSGVSTSYQWTTRTLEWNLSQPTRLVADLTTATRIECQSVLLENRGTADLVNPWVVVNGQHNWFNNSTILAEALGGETDQETRAFRLWDFACTNRYHWSPAEDGNEVHSPVKLLNVYGYGFCDDSAHFMECCWKLAGGPAARTWGLNGHVISELSYQGAWHVMDADLEAFYPLWDNRTVASVEDLADDGQLVSRVSGPSISDLYTSDDDNVYYQSWYDTAPTMAMTLRPNESLERCFYNWGKYHDRLHYSTDPPPLFANGRQIWRPELTNRAVATNGFSGFNNIDYVVNEDATGSKTARLSPSDPHNIATIKWQMNAPYVYVGGTLRVALRLETPFDNASIVMMGTNGNAIVLAELRGPLDEVVALSLDSAIAPKLQKAQYCLPLQIQLYGPAALSTASPTASISALESCAEFQCAPTALPELLASQLNTAEVTFSNAAPGCLKVGFVWKETDSAPRFPLVETPSFPLDGWLVPNTTPMLVWNTPLADTSIFWRSVKVSWDAAGFHPVSPLTSISGELPNQWQVPMGWLMPGATYHWRVQELDKNAPFSPAWMFRVDPDALDSRVSSWRGYQ